MLRNNNKINRIDNFFAWFLAVYLVYCNGSWLAFEAKTILQIGMLGIILLYVIFRKVYFNELSSPSFWILPLAGFPLISLLINVNGDANLASVIFVSITYILLSFFSGKTFNSIIDKTARFIYVLAIISIILGTITLINYPILLNIPVRRNDLFGSEGAMGYYNLILYTDRVANDFRTQSIFWEPGAWAFNQIFALYWFALVKKDYKKIWIFLLSLLLTLSTTGLFLTLILLVAVFLQSKESKFRLQIIRGVAALVFLLFVGSLYISSKTDLDIGQIVYEQTVEKFTSDSKSTSFDERIGSTKKAYEIALDNPFFGVGKVSADKQLFVTSGLAELAYQLGFIYLIVYLFFFRDFFSHLGWLLSIPFIIIMINGEAYSYYIISSLILIYGTKRLGKSKNIKVKDSE